MAAASKTPDQFRRVGQASGPLMSGLLGKLLWRSAILVPVKTSRFPLNVLSRNVYTGKFKGLVQRTNASPSLGALPSTPAMRQFKKIQTDNPGVMLLFQVGDFYEIYGEDAVKASHYLGLTLTAKKFSKFVDSDHGEVSMCGFPVHVLAQFLPKFVRNGVKVAVCDQTEDPEVAKKNKRVVQREVVRIVTPGTIVEDGMLQAKHNNYLMALYPSTRVENTIGLAWVDISTGQFKIGVSKPEQIATDIAMLDPSEILVPASLSSLLGPSNTGDTPSETLANPLKAVSKSRGKRDMSPPEAHAAPSSVPLHALHGRHVTVLNEPDAWGGSSLVSKYGMAFPEERALVASLQERYGAEACTAGGAVLHYLHATQKGNMPHLSLVGQVDASTSCMTIDITARRALELEKTNSGERKGSLLDVMDKTVTATGGRLLAQRMQSPSTDMEEINRRLSLVSLFHDHLAVSSSVREHLRKIYDIERCLQRLAMGRGGPVDLACIQTSWCSPPTLLDSPRHLHQPSASSGRSCLPA
eukprot:TRINITY_DN8779_c0_g1_i2.p1 TRINITY_DN8779_c0_g1~~TRINITY_DN8779_c0_g1_i2.p1  ORF type:complete len:538 (+),score=91.17 TRINITY_DN8779_c0_g1_i2:38-1615(+)